MNPAVLRNSGIFVQGAKKRKKMRPQAPELWKIFIDKYRLMV